PTLLLATKSCTTVSVCLTRYSSDRTSLRITSSVPSGEGSMSFITCLVSVIEGSSFPLTSSKRRSESNWTQSWTKSVLLSGEMQRPTVLRFASVCVWSCLPVSRSYTSTLLLISATRARYFPSGLVATFGVLPEKTTGSNSPTNWKRDSSAPSASRK